MDIYDLAPLYKILCISIILLVPVLPAWLLYKIAPEDKILAKGNFSGFQINATGAVAIFFVLFAAIYANIDGINKAIDRIPDDNTEIKELNSEVKFLQNKQPWNVECQVEILNRDTTPVDVNTMRKAYDACLQENSIQTMPVPMNVSSGEKTISFYVDDNVLKRCANSYSITLPHGFGTRNLKFTPTQINKLSKTISVIDTVYMNTKNSNLSGNRTAMSETYSIAQSRDSLPK